MINDVRIIAESECITVADLPAGIVNSVAPVGTMLPALSGEGSLREQLQKIEVEIIKCAIHGAQGDRRLAAQRLGISLSSLYRKLVESAQP